ncbi:hypothetical protein CDAR_382061 [Caerostris darwini]|uniref:Uncharacterized protein n=1 Tax=Caerostris darwini TaxID=1538125 RepID=A0AAV4V5L2_9ARAC|nr:hypothetical protein CDAR_382061 [Caerostris darwini]
MKSLDRNCTHTTTTDNSAYTEALKLLCRKNSLCRGRSRRWAGTNSGIAGDNEEEKLKACVPHWPAFKSSSLCPCSAAVLRSEIKHQEPRFD